MPIPYSVSHITSILSGIIKHEVLVTGKVSIDKRPGVFWLTQGGDKIRCFIPGRDTDQFGSLLKAGNTVVVDGTIKLFPVRSEYQISVADIRPIAKGPEMNQQLTVSEMTARLSSLIQDASALQNIQVPGDISDFFSDAKKAFWFLSDIGIVDSQRIHCVSFQTDGMAIDNGYQIQAGGNIQIWGAYSRYQINVTQIKPYNSAEHCQCSGCAQCTSAYRQCNRPREIANFESCAKCLPHPSDELYRLCPECYRVSPDHETKVKAAVYDYFRGLRVNGFSPYEERDIQFGTRNGIADVVLRDKNGSFAAIAECKGAGYTGHGIEQLKSYLAATDTRFGIFANSTEPDEWIFFENLRRYNFEENIPRVQFQTEIVAKRPIESIREEKDRLREEVCTLSTQRDQLQSEISTKNQQRMCLLKEINFLERDKDRLEKNRNKIKLEREGQRKAVKKEKEDWQRSITKQKQLRVRLEKTNADLDGQIRHKTPLIRELESRLDELNVTFVQESIYGQISKELEQLDKLESEIEQKQRVAQKNQDAHAAYERNKVEINQNRHQLVQISREKESILKQLRVVVNRLKIANLEQKAQIERHRQQLVQDLQERRYIFAQLTAKINQLKAAQSKLETKITEKTQQFFDEEEDMRPAYIHLQVRIDELKTKKSKLEAEIGRRIFMLLSKQD